MRVVLRGYEEILITFGGDVAVYGECGACVFACVSCVSFVCDLAVYGFWRD